MKKQYPSVMEAVVDRLDALKEDGRRWRSWIIFGFRLGAIVLAAILFLAELVDRGELRELFVKKA